MWTAAAAAMLGVLVAAATGSGAPPLLLLALLVALPVAITLGVRLRRRPHRSNTIAFPYWKESAAVESDTGTRGRTAAQHTTVEAAERTSPRVIASDDWDVVSEICGAFGSRQLDWFRSNDFVTPWLDFHAVAAVELEPLVARAVGVPFETDLRSAIRILADAIHTFVEYYRHHTFADPLLLGEDWRFFEWDDRGPADETDNRSDPWADRAAHLQQLAAGLAHAYEGFSVAAARNSNVRQRIEARA